MPKILLKIFNGLIPPNLKEFFATFTFFGQTQETGKRDYSIMARSALADVEARRAIRLTVSSKTISYDSVLTHVPCTPRSCHADVP